MKQATLHLFFFISGYIRFWKVVTASSIYALQSYMYMIYNNSSIAAYFARIKKRWFLHLFQLQKVYCYTVYILDSINSKEFRTK